KNLRKASLDRKSERRSLLGRKFEQTVAQYLTQLQAEGAIDRFVYHEPHSDADECGKDFTVEKSGTSVSFGVTISNNSARYARGIHPDVEVFYFPHNTKPETVKKRILDLLVKPM